MNKEDTLSSKIISRSQDYLIIPGINPVKEILIHKPDQLIEIRIDSSNKNKRIEELIKIAKEKKIRVLFVSKFELEKLITGVTHQGVMAFSQRFSYIALEDIIDVPNRETKNCVLLILDHITDEGNLGSIIRSSAFFGVDALIIPKDRSAQITESVIKRSAGALVHIPVSRVTNLNRTIEMLKDKGFWIIGADIDGDVSIFDFSWKGDIALVLGSEDTGLTKLIRDKCDQLVFIPGSGKVESLNVSNATGVILSEIFRQRK